MEIRIHKDGQDFGPYTLEQVKEYLATGQLQQNDLAFYEGLTDWVPLSQVPGVSDGQPAGDAEPQQPEQPDRSDFEYRIECQPDFSFLTVQIPGGETLKVEASAMASMDTNIQMKTKMSGGLGRLLTSESIFINEFSAQGGDGEITVAPGAPGDMSHVYLDGDDVIFLQNSAYVASGMDVNIETKWQGLVKGFFSGESLFLIKCSGRGDLWFNTYGAIIEIDVTGNYVVDTGYIVAFTDGLDYNVSSVGGYKSLFFSGEGLVCRFTGHGKVWIQTRQVPALANWIFPYRSQKSN